MNTTETLKLLQTMIPATTAIVCSLGRTSEAAHALFPDQTLFLDSMGDVTPVACGVALGMPKSPVVALDTDGSHLLGVTALATLGGVSAQLSNLCILVLDNGLYESGGGMPSRTCVLDWTALGQAFGLPIVEVGSQDELKSALSGVFQCLTFIVVKIVNSERAPDATKTVDGLESRYRFCRHLEKLSGRTILYPATKS